MPKSPWYTYFLSRFKGRGKPIDPEVMKQTLEGINDQVEGIDTHIENAISCVVGLPVVSLDLEVEVTTVDDSPALKLYHSASLQNLFRDDGIPVGFSYKDYATPTTSLYKYLQSARDLAASTDLTYYSDSEVASLWEVSKNSSGDVTVSVEGYVVIFVN